MMNTRSNFDSLLPVFGPMRQELQRAFHEAGDPDGGQQAALCPMSIWHDDQHMYLSADVPGLTESELDISYDDGKLWIRGERQPLDQQGEFSFNERYFGKFERWVKLPATVDPLNIEATLSGGVLQVTLPKKPEAQPRTIEIKSPRTRTAKKKLAENSPKK